MKNGKFNFVEYEMDNGEFITMSTAPILLLKLRNADKSAYEIISKTLVNGVKEDDVLGVYSLLYAAYLNANYDIEDKMSFTEFIENTNPSLLYNFEKIEEMVEPKKKQDSEQHSETQSSQTE